MTDMPMSAAKKQSPKYPTTAKLPPQPTPHLKIEVLIDN